MKKGVFQLEYSFSEKYYLHQIYTILFINDCFNNISWCPRPESNRYVRIRNDGF